MRKSLHEVTLKGPDFAETVTPKNDGTNSYAFISIGKIDNVLQVNSKSIAKELHMDLRLDSLINYPQSFNSFRDTARLYDTYEAYERLCSSNLLNNKFEFQEYLVENEATYSVGLQREIIKGIDNMQNSAKEVNRPIGCIFHFSIYIFSLLAFPSNEIIIIDSHPISEEISGNGNGIIVHLDNDNNWIMKRVMQSKVLSKSIPAMIILHRLLIWFN